MSFIKLDKNFDIATLNILINGSDNDREELIKRNTKQFYRAYLKEFSENLDTLRIKTNEYAEQLTQKIDITLLRLASTDNGADLDSEKISIIFMNTISAVKDALENTEAEALFSDELSSILSEEYLYYIL